MADLIPLSAVMAAPDASAGVPAQQGAPGLIGLDEITAAPKAAEPTPQMTGIARAAALPASGFAQGIMQTLAPFAAEGANPGGAISGVALPSTMDQTALASQLPAAAMDLGKQAGLYDRPDLTPQNAVEQGIVSAARGAGRALPAVALGGIGALPLGLATGATGGVAGDVAETALPDHPVLAQVAGNVLGSAGAAGIISGISHLAAPFLEAGTRAVSSGAEATQAAARLAKAMQSDIDSGAVTPTDFQNAAANGLKPWELENAENTRALAGTVTRSGGPARTTMRAYAKSEDTDAGQRIDDAFAQGMGTGDINGAISGLEKSRQASATPLYNQAFQQSAPVDISPVLKNIDEQIVQAKGGIKDSLVRVKSLLMDQNGQPDTSLQGLHNSKLAIDDIINGASDTPVGRNAKRLLIGTQKDLLSAMDSASTVDGTSLYAQARQAWGGPSQSLSAIEEGAAIGKKSAADITNDLSGLSPGDQALYRLSAMQQAIGPKIAGGSLGANEAARVLGNTPDKLKPQLEALFPDQASRDTALAAAQRANLKFQAKQAISGGSQTVERAVDQGAHGGGGGAIGNAIAAGVAMHTGEPFVSMTYLQRLAKDIVGHKMSASPSLNHTMAKMLVGNQDDLQPALSQLQPQGYSAPRIYPRLLAGQSIAAANQPAPNRQALIDQLMTR